MRRAVSAKLVWRKETALRHFAGGLVSRLPGLLHGRTASGQIRDGGAVTDVVDFAIDRLRQAGVRLERGLGEAELERVQDRFGFEFCAVHRRLLSAVLPAGSERFPQNKWPDWRSGSDEDLRGRLNWPVEGVVFDVLNNGFWSASWGDRPAGAPEADAIAREMVLSVPKMVPIFVHRYLPAAPAPENPPVFSIYQTDVIYYGDDLVDYVAQEFHVPPFHLNPVVGLRRVPFWSDLVDGAEVAQF
jgi:hypothetical protein